MRRRFYRCCLAALPVALGMLLAGCTGGTSNRAIPAEFSGDYAGAMVQVPGGTTGVIEATVFPNGSVEFDVSTTGGPFIATGGIDVADTLAATGLLNGATVDFIGTWSASTFGTASGTWVNRLTNDSGTWSIVQAGAATTGAAGDYTGSFSLPGFTGALAFSIGANGHVTGTASGIQAFETSLTGSLTRANVLVLAGATGIGGTGDAVFFVGTLNTTTFNVTGGTAGASLAGGVTGTWAAAKAP